MIAFAFYKQRQQHGRNHGNRHADGKYQRIFQRRARHNDRGKRQPIDEHGVFGQQPVHWSHFTPVLF